MRRPHLPAGVFTDLHDLIHHRPDLDGIGIAAVATHGLVTG